MTINEAIYWLQKDKDRWETIGNEVRAEACSMAIGALQNIAEQLERKGGQHEERQQPQA